MPSKPNLYIAGAGKFGREVESMLGMVPEADRDFNLVGYLDDFPDALKGKRSDYQICGGFASFVFAPGDRVLIAMADSRRRLELYNLFKGRAEIATFIHPSVTRFKFVEVGEGSIVVSNCVLSTGVKLGKCVILNQSTQIGHDCEVGDFCSIMSAVNLGGDCQIGSHVFMGLSATIIPEMKVGDGAVIGAGSVVIRNVKPGVTVFGNPAKLV